MVVSAVIGRSTAQSAADEHASATGPVEGPLSVAVLAGWDDTECPTRFFLPQDVDELGSDIPLPDEYAFDEAYEAYMNSFSAWVTSAGGWQAKNSVRFSVEGNLSRATILTGIRVNLVSRAALTSRTVVSIGQCGAPAPPRYFSVDLAPTPPRVRALPGEEMDDEGNFVPVDAVDFPFTVSETDPEIFDLKVEPGPVCDCQWTATLSYVQAGRSYTTTIDDGGKPFHAVPTDDVPEYTVINGYLERVEK
ncbi:hypothetical protein [Actinophytocola sp.]|uniref:hypothetical protein n=1 Tax=Actinophytocola sp. TaxID=1872138 RepID=UPI002ED3F124